jgi:lipoic acid synthetase
MKPVWLRGKLSNRPLLQKTREALRRHRLNTVCDEALCPNLCECFGQGVATFLILGRTCTRACTFCAIPAEKTPPRPDPAEPGRIAAAAADLGLKHIVITSVTRDDLTDGGAAHFAATVRALKRANPSLTVEVLIPDLQGERTALEILLASRPDVVNHNIETVPRLYPAARPQADYRRSLRVLKMSKEIYPQGVTKSGLMLGLGEERGEVLAVMADLRAVDCDILTIGQYLQPSAAHHPVVRYVPPAEFADFEREGRRLGFRAIFSGPLVRSSFHAAAVFAEICAGAPGQPPDSAPPAVAVEGEGSAWAPEETTRMEVTVNDREEEHEDL